MGLSIRLAGQNSLDSQTSESSSEVTIMNDGYRTSTSSWPASSGSHKCLAVLHGQDVQVGALALSSEFLFAGSSKGDIRAWNCPSMQEALKFGCSEGAVKCLIVVGSKIISAHQDHKIRVWRRSKSNSQEHKLLTTLPSVKDYITNLLPPKNYVQVRRHQKTLWINHHDCITSLVVGNDVLYSGSWDKSVKVWRLEDFKCLESLNVHIDAVNAITVDTRNDLLYSGSGDTTIKVFQRQESEGKQYRHVLIATLEAKSPVNALALSPDGSVLYSGQSNKSVIVWKMHVGETRQWTAVGTLPGHRMSILCLSTLSNLLISGSADKTIRVWKRNDDGLHTCVSVMVGHTGPVKSLCAMPDAGWGVLVYSGSSDGDIRVWWVPDDEPDSVSSDETNALDSPLVVNWRASTPNPRDSSRPTASS